MATARKVQLSTADTGVFSVQKATRESADTASRILQENHEKYNLYFNDTGFHNHIAHQILTLYGLGAPAAVLEAHYRANATYQMEPRALDEENVVAMRRPEGFKRFLGKMQHTHDYVEFFTREIANRGVESVVQEYLFSGTETAEDMLVRLFMGFLHPIIHLGFGLEFKQPLIVAEALAQAATHENWLAPFFFSAEKAARQTQTSKTLPELIDEIHADKKLSTAAEWSDDNKIRNGILVRAPDEMTHYAAQFHVAPHQLAAKTAEMMQNVVFYTAAAQRPPKAVRFDFYFMHCVNSSVFWPTFNSLPWLSTAAKCRLLEWKGRLDLAMYASRRSPALLGEEIRGYVSRDEAGWKELATRLFAIPGDDGHGVKFLRALGAAETTCKPSEREGWARIRGGAWQRVGNMVVDSVEEAQGREGGTWARSVGFDEAWEGVGERVKRGVL